MKTKAVTCPNCDGHQLVTNTFSGEPDDCRACDNGYVIEAVRDKRGRFLPEKRKGKP